VKERWDFRNLRLLHCALSLWERAGVRVRSPLLFTLLYGKTPAGKRTDREGDRLKKEKGEGRKVVGVFF